MKKIYLIKDLQKFSNALKELVQKYTAQQIAAKLQVNVSTISRWKNGQFGTHSKYINQLIEIYHLSEKELGVKSKEIEENAFSIRLKNLIKKHNLLQKDLADLVEFSKPEVSNWITKGTMPKLETIYDLSNIFNVNYLYLLGAISEPTVNSDSIRELLGLKSATSNSIIQYKKNNNLGNITNKSILETYKFNYIDIIDCLLQSNLVDILYFELYRTLTYDSGNDYTNKFDDLFNSIDIDYEEDIGNDTSFMSELFPTPAKISQVDVSKALLQREICKLFDKLLNEKQKEQTNNTKNNKNNTKINQDTARPKPRKLFPDVIQ